MNPYAPINANSPRVAYVLVSLQGGGMGFGGEKAHSKVSLLCSNVLLNNACCGPKHYKNLGLRAMRLILVFGKHFAK